MSQQEFEQNDNPVSQEVWENIFNDPVRKAAADKRAAEEAEIRQSRNETLAAFRQKCASKAKERVELQACRYTFTALAAGAAAYFVGTGGIGWLAWVLGAAAVVLGMIASYGFGCVHEIGKHRG